MFVRVFFLSSSILSSLLIFSSNLIIVYVVSSGCISISKVKTLVQQKSILEKNVCQSLLVFDSVFLVDIFIKPYWPYCIRIQWLYLISQYMRYPRFKTLKNQKICLWESSCLRFCLPCSYFHQNHRNFRIRSGNQPLSSQMVRTSSLPYSLSLTIRRKR
jgi:hypothetical protein